MSDKKRYVLVGTGGRAEFLWRTGAEFPRQIRACAFCDINQTRMNYANQAAREKYKYTEVPTYPADQFDRMIENEA